MSQYPATALDNKMVVAIGKPTTAALAAVGRPPDTVAVAATVEDAIMALARLAAFR
jgi:uroporphyrinogen-III synthase